MENSGAASFALTTVARAGVAPATTQASQTLFISANVDMSVNQMVALSSLLLSLLAPASRAVDGRQNVLGLFRHALSRRTGGNLPGQIDG